MRTRAGYTGGAKKNPTYYSLGNHTEAMQVDFDPTIISFDEILTLFWQSHNPSARAWSAQYKNALWVHNDEQAALAEASKARLAEEKSSRFFGRGIHTEILPLDTFYLAEEYHQKYMLRRAKSIWNELMAIYPHDMDWINSTAAARLNGYVGGQGSTKQLDGEIELLGLSVEGQDKLRQIVRGRW